MAILPDHKIKEYVDDGTIGVDPYDESNVEPASLDLTLGSGFKRALVGGSRPIDLADTSGDEIRWIESDYSVKIKPGDFVLATTKERVALPEYIVGEVLGRSSLGRIGLSVHQTAGYIDPGFEGQITLELSNHGPTPVTLTEGQRICQIVFSIMDYKVEKPYGHEGSQYQGQTGATDSGMQFD